MTESQLLKESKLVYECSADICWKNKGDKEIIPPDNFILYITRKKDDSFCGTAIGSRNPADVKIITIENNFILFTKGNTKYSAVKSAGNDYYLGIWEDDERNRSSFRIHVSE